MRSKKKSIPFVRMFKTILYSQKWKELTHSEMLMYIYLKSNFNGNNNNKITFKYIDITGIFSKATIAKALKGLVKKGWIEKTQHGGLFRFYCLYKLTGNYDKL